MHPPQSPERGGQTKRLGTSTPVGVSSHLAGPSGSSLRLRRLRSQAAKRAKRGTRLGLGRGLSLTITIIDRNHNCHFCLFLVGLKCPGVSTPCDDVTKVQDDWASLVYRID